MSWRPMHKLSILIPSLEERKPKLERLKAELASQIGKRNVEVLSLSDNRQMTIGQKRNMLLTQSTGEYVSFVDDDDMVSPDYIEKVLNALTKNPDCSSLTGEIVFSDGYSRPFIHSLRYDRWIDDHNGKVYYRPPNHLNAVRRAIAAQVGFPPWNSGEDRSFSMGIRHFLKKEEWIEGVIYNYKCSKTFEETHNNQVTR
jgi:cellulose synthase/poly-beta-1,6-N-acetylglucosamine synthase-like glycosyltransferase